MSSVEDSSSLVDKTSNKSSEPEDTKNKSNTEEKSEKEISKIKDSSESPKLEKSSSETKFTLRKLKDFFIQKNFEIQKLYTEGGFYRFIQLLSTQTGEVILIYILSKYPIKEDPNISNEFTTLEIEPFEENLSYHPSSPGDITHYNEIQDKTLNSTVKNEISLSSSPKNSDEVNNPTEELKTLEDKLTQQYDTIDIEKENFKEVSNTLTVFVQQLERLQLCTANIKYKLAIISPGTLAYISRQNEVCSYRIKNGKISDSLTSYLSLVMIDIESFYEKIEQITEEIATFYYNFYKILNTAHLKQMDLIVQKIKAYQDLSSKLNKYYDQHLAIVKDISSISSTLKGINQEEKKVVDKYNSIFSDRTGPTINTSRSFRLGEAEKELLSIQKLKSEALELYSTTKNRYMNGLLDYDRALFDNLLLFKRISNNFSLLKI
jgi:hypothetical protein